MINIIIVVSACLLGKNYKYNGGNNFSEKVRDFIKGHEVISLCPEVLGGLPTPRVPAEIVGGIVTMRDGTNVDRAFRSGAEIAFRKVIESGAKLCILQSRSPSCGVKEVYDGTFSGQKIPGQGVFAKMLMDAGIKVIDVEELEMG